jgi:phosphoenolpyruvate synthase/pyruvate phosphate dikinase
MLAELVLPLEESIELSLCGGKATALGELFRAGFETVGGFVVTTAAYNRMSSGLQDKILRAYDDLGSKYVAVRSSATAEDSKEAAWAGQLDTYLNVSRNELIDSIKKCWTSINSERANSYAHQHKIKTGKVAVIVQPMIQFLGGGVAFSIHPVTKDSDKIVIEVALGLEAVVSGETTPDTYVVNKQDQRILEKYISIQTKKMIQGKDGKTKWEKIGSQGSKQKLSDDKIIELSKQVIKLEKHFGFPVDVEWGLVGDKILIMQCRPITTL